MCVKESNFQMVLVFDSSPRLRLGLVHLFYNDSTGRIPPWGIFSYLKMTLNVTPLWFCRSTRSSNPDGLLLLVEAEG